MDWPTALVIIAIVIAACMRMDDAFETVKRWRERRLKMQVEFTDLDKLHTALISITRDDDSHADVILAAASALEALARQNEQLQRKLEEALTRSRP